MAVTACWVAAVAPAVVLCVRGLGPRYVCLRPSWAALVFVAPPDPGDKEHRGAPAPEGVNRRLGLLSDGGHRTFSAACLAV